MKTEAKKSAKRTRQNNFQTSGGSSDIYEKFTNLIIEKLEQGIIPWKQPWNDLGLPSNYLTKAGKTSALEALRKLFALCNSSFNCKKKRKHAAAILLFPSTNP